MNKADIKLITRKHKIKVELSVTVTMAAEKICGARGKVISRRPIIFKQG